MGWFDKLSGKPEPMPMVAESAPFDSARLMVEPNDNIHHEYFVNDEAVNGLFAWHCRVYAKDSTPHEMTGSTESREQAASAAQSWAAEKKRELRGIA